MNVIFISPQFPDTYWNWCDRLQKNGATVLGIGDTPYDIEAAARAGVATIALRCGGFSNQDLAGAIGVYDDPEQLAVELEEALRAGG